MDYLESIRADLIHKAKILIVDDEPQILSALKRELRGEGFQIVTLDSPMEALLAIQREEFALIVSDNRMPGMTGLDFLAKAKTIAPITKRILLTGKTEQIDAIRAFNSGVIHRFMDKPWSKEELIQAIKEDIDAYLVVKMEQRLDQIKMATIKRRSEQLDYANRQLLEAKTELNLERSKSADTEIVIPKEVKVLRFLLVDKNQGVAKGLEAALRKGGVENVALAPDGLEALNRVDKAEEIFDVIISEWDLEKVSGLNLLKTIRARQELPVQPHFIFITSLSNREAVEYAHLAHADGYLLKPFELGRLVNHLNELVSGLDRPQRLYTITGIKKMQVLVANPDSTKRLFLQKCLGTVEAKKYFLADSGTKALNLLVKEHIDVILYDATLKDPTWQNLRPKLESIGCKSDQPIMVTNYQSPDKPEESGVEPKFWLKPGFSQDDFNRVLIESMQAIEP